MGLKAGTSILNKNVKILKAERKIGDEGLPVESREIQKEYFIVSGQMDSL